MHWFDIILLLIIGTPFLVLCVPLLFDARRERGLGRFLLAFGVMFLAVGAVGFFGSALSSLGGLNWLGSNFQWPVGFASGVLTTTNSIHVVPHTPSGRIQLYDAEWRFLRGWPVDANGGTFKLVSVDSNQVDVVTARGQLRYVFDFDGKLISQGTYAPASYGDFVESPHAYWLPLAPWLWVFSHPFLSWASLALGLVLLGIQDKLKKRARRKKPSLNRHA